MQIADPFKLIVHWMQFNPETMAKQENPREMEIKIMDL